MAYPKPLTKKSLDRLYRQAELTEEVSDFLHRLFAALANLYGAISLRSAWSIYLETKDTAPRVRRKDMVAFSSIVRREVQPYCVFEIEELYSDEPHSEMDRHIVNRVLIRSGYGKFFRFYDLLDQVADRQYYVPEDILSFAEPRQTEREKALLRFLEELKVTADESVTGYGTPCKCEHKGKRLKEFSFLNSDERFDAEYLQKRPSALAALMAEVSGTEAEKIVRKYKRMDNIGACDVNMSFQYIFRELEEVGVELEMAQAETLMRLIVDLHNNTHLWCLAGWTPSELSEAYGRRGPAAITFGPGLQKAFAAGELDKEEFVRQFRELGMEVTE